jgi:Alkylmercury lyase
MTTPLEPAQSPSKGNAAAALSPSARGVHRRVLQEFAASGRAPEPAELRRLALEQDADPDAVLAELAASDVIAFDDAGRIRAAYPFSPAPTAIRVSWPGGPTVHAMCAIDALGISAMLGHPVVITASEPGTGRTITVEVDHGHALWHPDTAVVFAGTLGEACCGPAVDRSCGTINFFTTSSTARTWAETRPHITGRVLGQAEALASAIAQFGALLHEP